MKILFIQKEGVDLYTTLRESETSRKILRFYRPLRRQCGVEIGVSTLGGALSLTSELQWYIRRYVSTTLLRLSDGRYCSPEYAQEIYGREEEIHSDDFMSKYTLVKNGTLSGECWLDGTYTEDEVEEFCKSADSFFHVICGRKERGQ